MDSVKLLVSEHDNILRMLDVIHSASLTILGGAPVEVADFRAVVAFIRKYADKTHHGKEEDYLFKAMVGDLGPVAENLVHHGMLVEHDIARLYVSDLENGLDAYEQSPSDEARLCVLVAAGSYEQLLRRHIQKENEVVFPFGARSLTKESTRRVEEQVAAFEADEANARDRAHQLSVLDALETKYRR